MKYAILLLIILIVFAVWRKINSKNNKEQIVDVNDSKSPKESFMEIVKDEVLIDNSLELNMMYDFEISSVTKKENTLDILITIHNKSDKTVRIDLKEATYSLYFTKKVLKAAITFYEELNMGTNDILLKNTILPDSQLIRNIYFFNTNLDQFHQNDALTIDLMINNQSYQLKRYLYQSDIQLIKIVC